MYILIQGFKDVLIYVTGFKSNVVNYAVVLCTNHVKLATVTACHLMVPVAFYCK